jgi:hypothetical protein
MSRPWYLARWLVALIVLADLPALGQGPIPPKPSPWSFEVTPYLWTAGFHGDLSARGREATVDAAFSDLLKELDFGAMLLGEVRYDRWGLLLDGFYIKLSQDADTPGPAFSRVDVTSETGMLGPSLAYRAVWTDRFSLDVLAGARFWFVDTELDFRPGAIPGFRVDQSTSWIDPTVGLRLGVELTDRFSLKALGDVGGFGVGSDVTWQGFAGVGYRFDPRWSVSAGYRALGVDFRRGGFELDVIMHGPVAGIGYRF